MSTGRKSLAGFGALAFVALSLAGAPALAKPATTLKIPETTDWSATEDRDWFVRGDLSTDVPFQGATGGGLSVGHFSRFYFLDVSFMYFHTSWGAINVYQPQNAGAVAGSDVARTRLSSDQGSLFAIGPGIGSIFKFFDSEHWIEMARFGLNYAQFQDSTLGIGYRGGLATFNASFGYNMSSVVIAPGMTWNLGFFQNTTATSVTSTSHQGYLPLQWFSWQVSLYFFL